MDTPLTSNADPYPTMHELHTTPPLAYPSSLSDQTLAGSSSSERVYKTSSKSERRLRVLGPKPLRPKRKETPEEQEARNKEKLKRSKYLASLLNLDSEREQIRRAEAGLRPLMSLTIPDDFRCVPRVFAYVLDDALQQRLKEISHSYFGLSKDLSRSNIQYATYGMLAVEQRLRIRLEVECAVRELPARVEDEFLVLVVIFASKYRQLRKRPTELQVKQLSTTFRCQPEWFIHAP